MKMSSVHIEFFERTQNFQMEWPLGNVIIDSFPSEPEKFNLAQ